MNNTIKIEKKKRFSKKSIKDIFIKIYDLLSNDDFLYNYVKSNKAFTRSRKLTLTIMVKLLFVRVFTSLTTFLTIELTGKHRCTKQAFSKARKNISDQLFIDLNYEIICDIYSNHNLKLFNNKYYIFSIDGTTLELPNTQYMRDTMGHSQGQKGAKEVARASASCIFDCESDFIITSTIERYGTSEREMLIKMINDTKNIFENVIYIMDRGYFSKKLLQFFNENDLLFLFRVKSDHLRNYFNKMEGNDEVVEYKVENNIYKIRITKVKLSTGEEEHLVSNLDMKEIPTYQMKSLYFKRWRIEIAYNFLKNTMLIENFSGRTELNIKQEFYSCILNSNINMLIIKAVKTKQTKTHAYQANKKTLYSLYHETIIKRILSKISQLKKYIEDIITIIQAGQIIKCPPDKHNKRNINDKVKKNKFVTNARPI